MERNLDGEVRVFSFEGGYVSGFIDEIRPFTLWDGTSQYGSIAAAIQRTKAGAGTAKTFFGIGFNGDELDGERIAGFGAVNVERTRKWIGAGDFVAFGFGLFTVGIDSGGVDDIARFYVHNRRQVAVDGFQLPHFEFVMNNVLRQKRCTSCEISQAKFSHFRR